MLLCHATNADGFKKIIESGCIKPGIDGIVYLADSRMHALRFIAPRVSVVEDVYVFEVEVPDQEVFETFDHSFQVFKCKSYGYKNSITSDMWTSCINYPGPGGI